MDAVNPAYSTVAGVLFDKSQTTLIKCPAAKTGSYAVPNSVNSIGYEAFASARLTSVTIPNSVISIEGLAFDGCSSLTSVTMGNSVTNIGFQAFYNCTSLTNVTIPTSVTSIGSATFYDCTSLTGITIPNSVTNIGYAAFEYCTSLTSIVIPNSVTIVGDGAFADCSGLTNVSIGSGVTTIGSSAFADCVRLTSLKLSDAAIQVLNFLLSMSQLSYMELENDRLSDLSPLAGLTNLQHLDLSGNSLMQIVPLQNLPRLSYLDLTQNYLDTNPGSAAMSVITNLQARGVVVLYIPQRQNQPPTISVATNWSIPANLTSTLAFSVNDDQTPPDQLAVARNSSNQALIPNENIAIAGNGYNRTLTVTPATGQSGSAAISLTVTDNTGLSTNATIMVTVTNPPIVIIPDPNLEAAIRSALGKPTGGLTSLDLEQLAYLSAQWQNISNLSGLEWAGNLATLSVYGNSIRDATPLAGLTNLASLDLGANSVGNLFFLERLTGLTYLRLYNNGVIDISPIARLTNLTGLDLGYNPLANYAQLSGLSNLISLSLYGNSISNLVFLQGLTELSSLVLFNNLISDLSPLAGLTNLSYLSLSGNAISNLASLQGLAELRWLYLDNNRITDIAPLSGLSNLEDLYLSYNPTVDFAPVSVLTNLTGLYLNGNSISNLVFLVGLNRLNYLELSYNHVTDLSRLAGMTNLTWLDLSYNPITNYLAMAGLSNLYSLTLSGNSISNLSFVQGLTRLSALYLKQNRLGDLSALAGLTNLYGIDASYNCLTNINALTNLLQLSWVNVQVNLLDLSPGSATMNVITNLQARGVNMNYLPQNQPPTISVPSNWIIPANETSSMGLSVWDDETSQDQLILTAHSSNTGLITEANTIIRGTNAFPFPYPCWQWSLNLTPTLNQTGTTTITLTATDDTGLSTNASFLVTVLMPLAFDGQVVNCSNFVWRTFGTTPWFGQTNVSHDGHAAAQSGSPEAWLETTVTGPGVLTFWWKSSGTNHYWPGGYSTATCASSGLSGYSWLPEGTDWRKETVSLPAGSWVLRWQTSGAGMPGDLSSTWLDEVNFVPGPTVCWLEVAPADLFPPGYFWLDLHGEIGGDYDLEVSSDLRNWSALARLSFDNFEYGFNDSDPMAVARFYRLHKVMPVWLEIVGRPAGGQCQLMLHGQPAMAYQILVSTNLVTWSTLATVTNTLGSVSWTDALPTNSPGRFYRAMQIFR